MYGGMYGSGLGMGGMGGMYGGMGGMGSSMYGGGLGMGGGMYGGGLGMGGMGSSMYGSGGMYGSSGLSGGSSYGMSGGMNGFGRSNQLSSANNMNNGVGGDGLQGNGMQSPLNLQGPDQANQLASPINQNTTPLPPLNESPEERSRRIQAEHKKERQLIRQQREQHRQARLQARMEIAGHFTNILVQGLRSAMELFGVCFGTYYSMKAVRAFSSMQPGMGMMGGQRFPTAAIQQQQAAAATAAARSQQVAATGAATAGPSRWRTWLLCIALFILGEVAYSVATRQRTKPPQRRRRISGPTEDAYGNVISQDEYEVSIRSTDDESEMTEKEREEESMSDAWSQAYGTSNGNNIYGGLHGSSAGGNRGVRRVFYALYDYEAPQADGSCLSFRAGDEFVVEDYVEGSWCEATAVDGGNYSSRGRRGLVPSNFLRLVERATKL